MKYLLLLFISYLLLSTTVTFAQSSAAECPSLNFQSRFSVEKNQGLHNYCWAMAGTSLLEEEYCLQNPQFCGQSLSTLDASSCRWRWGHKDETGIPSWVIHCAQEQGVCAEAQAPYRPFQVKNTILGYLGSKEFHRSAFVDSFFRLKARGQGHCHFCSTPETESQFMNQFISDFRAHFIENDLSDLELRTYASKAKDLADFLDKAVIPHHCVSNRIRPSRPIHSKTYIFEHKTPLIRSYFSKADFENFLTPATADEKNQLIIERLKKGRSVSVGVCLEEVLPEYKLFSQKPCQFGHAIILNGLQWNAQEQRCEVHVRNTFGTNSSLRGWKNLKEIGAATFLLEQIVTN